MALSTPAVPSTASKAPWPPAVLPYRDNIPIPPGYHLESEARTGLGIGGLVILGVPYVTGMVAAAASGFSKGSAWLVVPVAGPFLAMGGRNIDCNFISSSGVAVEMEKEQDQCRKEVVSEARIVALLTVSGLVQTAGAILSTAGFVTKDRYLIRNDISPEPTQEPPPAPAITVDGAYQNGHVRLTALLRF